MPRALFEKTGNAAYISHLDLMRVFQRAFKRADLPLTHTKGFNPRPSVSIAMPLSLGMESICELLDFELESAPVSNEDILKRLNASLISGVKVLRVYDDADKLKGLAFLDCSVTLEYDAGIPQNAKAAIEELFAQPEVLVEKKSKNGVSEQNIIPMIRNITVEACSANDLRIDARICCQNPSLNPMQLSAAISRYLPQFTPDFVRCKRIEIYNNNNEIFR